MDSSRHRTDAIASPGHLFIGGAWVPPSTSERIDVVDAATEQVWLQVASASAADVDAAITAARHAFDVGEWPRLSHAERATYLRALAAAVRRRGPELSDIWTSETGVLNSLARVMSNNSAATFEYYADLAQTYPFVERHRPTAGGKVGYLVREPVGVVGAILPWNSPLGMIAFKTAPALLAGCTIVLKASPDAPGEAYVIAEIAQEIGLPPGVLNVLTAHPEASEVLVRDPRVDKITFTGSTAAGRRIGAILGKRVARFTLELGGKSAAVVLDDYDAGLAAASIAGQACMMTGQVCATLTRVVVDRRRHDELVDALAAAFADVAVGDPFDPGTAMGPLATRRQLRVVEGFIARGVADGATLAGGGGRPAGLDRGFFVRPTVFGRVDNSSELAQEEIFGPVVSVIAADGERDAVRIANDTRYGLNASVYTHDVDRAYAVARQLRSGTVGHNARRIDFGIAFGGFKQSGVGREGGREGLLPFLETKTLVLDGEPTGLAAPGPGGSS